MDLPMNEKSQRLLDTLMAIPPDFAAAETLLQQTCFSPDEVAKVATRYMDECNLDAADTFCLDPYERISPPVFMSPSEVVSGRHSTHLCDVVYLLLDYRLNPNTIIDEENVTFFPQ